MLKKLLLVLLLCMFTVGCAQPATLINFMPEFTGEIDLGGMTLYFNTDVDPNLSMYTTFMSYGANTTNYDSAVQRFADVEKELNVNIEFCTPVGNRNMLLSAAAEKRMDMCIFPIYYGEFDEVISGLYTPLSQLPQIDYRDSAKWGTPNMLEIFCNGGEIYGVLPAYWPDINIMSLDFLLVINEEMAERNGMTDPRDLFEQGQWTHDNFLKTVSDFYVNEADKIVYGYSGDPRHLMDMTFKSFNVDFVSKNGDVYENGYNSDDFIKALDWARLLINGEYSEMCIFEGMKCVQHWVDDMTGIATVHMNYFASLGGSDSSSDIINADKEYGIVPFPSLDGKTIHAQFERVINGIMFPSWSIYSEEASIVANAIFEPFEGLETHELQKENLNSNLFFDERDTNLIFNMLTEARFVFLQDGVNDCHAYYVDQIDKSSAELQQAYAHVMDEAIEKYIGPARATLEELFGYTG